MPAVKKRKSVRKTARSWRPLGHWQRRLVVAAAVTVSLSLVATGGYQLWRHGIVGDAYAAVDRFVDGRIRAAGLTVQDVLVSGRAQADVTDVRNSLSVERGSSIFGFSPADARERLVALDWVRDARVERRWPDTIVVHLDEHQPMALWQNKGRLVLIDRRGETITRANLGRFGHLPLVIGDDAPANASALIDMLAEEPTLFARVEAAQRVGGRRWNIRLRDNIDVNLPEDNPQAAWAKLANLVNEHRILERDVAVIDLRLPDRLVVRMTTEGSKRRRQGKDA